MPQIAGSQIIGKRVPDGLMCEWMDGVHGMRRGRMDWIGLGWRPMGWIEMRWGGFGLGWTELARTWMDGWMEGLMDGWSCLVFTSMGSTTPHMRDPFANGILDTH